MRTLTFQDLYDMDTKSSILFPVGLGLLETDQPVSTTFWHFHELIGNGVPELLSMWRMYFLDWSPLFEVCLVVSSWRQQTGSNFLSMISRLADVFLDEFLRVVKLILAVGNTTRNRGEDHQAAKCSKSTSRPSSSWQSSTNHVTQYTRNNSTALPPARILYLRLWSTTLTNRRKRRNQPYPISLCDIWNPMMSFLDGFWGFWGRPTRLPPISTVAAEYRRCVLEWFQVWQMCFLDGLRLSEIGPIE